MMREMEQNSKKAADSERWLRPHLLAERSRSRQVESKQAVHGKIALSLRFESDRASYGFQLKKVKSADGRDESRMKEDGRFMLFHPAVSFPTRASRYQASIPALFERHFFLFENECAQDSI
jgi:hypothetical protein